MLDRIRNDLLHAFRLLRRGGSFSVIAVLTLALGMGANSAMFSVVHALLLRPLPYPEADRLIWIATIMATPDNLEAWRAGMRTLEQVEGFNTRLVVRTGDGPAERIDVMGVTPGFLPLLGAQPVRGRLWTASEASQGPAAGIVVSHGFWNRVLGGADIADRSVLLDGVTHPVVGVLSPGFENLGYDSDIWTLLPPSGTAGLNLVGRARPGVDVAAVRAEANELIERVESPLAETFGRRFANVHTVMTMMSGDARTPVLVLFAAAGFVLLIACANVANLLLARAAGRTREMAVRAAIGASRRDLLRQLLVESSVLALAGALAGLVLARWALQAVIAYAPAYRAFERLSDVRIDAVVFGFTLLVVLATTLLAGLAPALAAARGEAAAAGARVAGTRSARRWREALIAAEVALALVLMIGTLLLVRTFLTLRPASPGFETRDRLVTTISVPADGGARNIAFARSLLAEVERASPGVRASLVSVVPLSGVSGFYPVIEADGQPVGTEGGVRLHFRAASPDYHERIGMRIVRGRGLRESDTPGSPHVIVLNETAARRLFPELADPSGHAVTIDFGRETAVFTVAGIVTDTRFTGNSTAATAEGFVSYWQRPHGASFRLVTYVPPGSSSLTAQSIGDIVARLAPDVPVGPTTSLQAIADRAVSEPRFHMTLMSAFGVLGVLLAMAGCYGVLAYSVAQRTREIGVRTALGASRGVILRSVLGRAALLVTCGLAAGALLALGVTRVLEGSLFGVTATDPLTFALAAGALAVVSLAAAWGPARRAARIEPAVAFRLD